MAITVIPELGSSWPSTLKVTYNANGLNLAEGETSGIRIDSKGRLITTQEKRATYSAACVNLAIAAAGTDFFTITGSASKTIIVKRIRFSASSSTTVQSNIGLCRRSTANTGGTSTTLTNVKHDTTNSPATAVVRAYTANPTLGTLVEYLRWIDYTSMAPSSNSPTDIREFAFGIEEDQGIILRGLNEVLALNFNEQTVTFGAGVGYNLSVEWREIVGG